jgi:two-component system sensor kinase FixL
VLALAVLALSLVARLALQPWLGRSVPYLQFFPAILIASRFWGVGPGILSTALATLISAFFILPADGLVATEAGHVVSLTLFAATGLGIAWVTRERSTLAGRYRQEEALAASHAQRLEAIINTTVEGIVVIDAHGIVEAFNRGAERLFGYAESEVVGRNVAMLMPSPYREEHDGYIARYLSTGTARIIGIGREVNGRRKDGTVFPLHLAVSEMRIAGERKFTGVLHDLTERVRLESDLRASEARWRSIIRSAVDGIIVIDTRGHIEAFNPAAERLFGYNEAEVLGRNVHLLMPSPYREEHDGYLARYLVTGVPRIIGMGREVTARKKDGSTFPVHLAVGEVLVEGERKFTGIVHDLSVRVRMEEQLREQTALARLGEMAAVIAHEVKNPLAGIRGVIQVIAGRLPRDSRDGTVLKDVVARIDGLNELMKDLLLFSRPPQPHVAPVDVRALVANTAGLLAEDPAVRAVRVEVHGSSPPVIADAELLKIVFVNLLVNAAQAMQGQGVVHVSVTGHDGTCSVVFQDAGPGIPADVRDRIFTPFFTTKARGSGLGLPTAKRLIEAHSGTIAVECPQSGGTRVIVRLPLS